MRVLPKTPSASIHDIADEAGVGRSTVHRYFDERSALIQALARHVYELSNDAIVRAVPDSGPPLQALRRLAEEQLDLGLALDFICHEKLCLLQPEIFAGLTDADEIVRATVERALRPDRRAPPDWGLRSYRTLLRLAAELVAEGTPRHQALDAMMGTLTAGIFAADPPEGAA
ncbi:TetR/AcrR family transcriptional regulator [Falsigemmobacter faecalis]|uniref:TetR/AcrR family transcriptional regulator n=2 Tax=Falsigemmobacter faecalis TaxID=2488730 RepID=A0A3P3DWB6_9RHOB|nr:TetR/AcrR family transcriptional regulator [Falsigemmobacter faecalis]